MDKINYKFFLLTFGLMYLAGCHFYSENYKFAGISVPGVYEQPKQEALVSGDYIPPCCKGNYCWDFTPLFRYDITAFIFGTSHKFVSDFGNIMSDIGLLWGENASKSYYRDVELRVMMDHYYVRWKDGQNFNLYDAANTHIVSCDGDAYSRIRSLKSGDQVRIRGFLVNARISKGPGEKDPAKIITWNSSVTRQDTGEGACELLYVKTASDVEILAKGHRYWFYLKYSGLAGFLFFCVLLLVNFHSKNKKELEEVAKINF